MPNILTKRVAESIHEARLSAKTSQADVSSTPLDPEFKVRVRMLTGICPAGSTFAFRRGDHPTVPALIAREWTRHGFAVEAPEGGRVESAIAKFGFGLAAIRGFDPNWKPNATLTTATVSL